MDTSAFLGCSTIKKYGAHIREIVGTNGNPNDYLTTARFRELFILARIFGNFLWDERLAQNVRLTMRSGLFKEG